MSCWYFTEHIEQIILMDNEYKIYFTTTIHSKLYDGDNFTGLVNINYNKNAKNMNITDIDTTNKKLITDEYNKYDFEDFDFKNIKLDCVYDNVDSSNKPIDINEFWKFTDKYI
jgi:hypothetical protein